MARKSRPRPIQAAPPDARLLSRDQAARRLAISVVTVDRLVKRGLLHPVNLLELRRVLFSAAEIDALVVEASSARPSPR